MDGVPDLCQLIYLNEPNVLHNLDHRYKNGKIYTSTTAKVLIAVNPYEKVPGNDSDSTLATYQSAPVNLEGLLTAESLEPHVFTVAHAAYHNMCAKKDNQSVVVCGESGSGKTESAKLFMKFLAYTSTVTSLEPTEFCEAQKIGQQVLDANPILESFGNAKTVLNNNSSRFGKFTKMIFTERPGQHDMRLVGAVIETYLLEKSRVVTQDPGERNYHAFYILCSAAKQFPELELGSGNPEDFYYLNQSGCTTFDGDSSQDAKDFQILVDAFDTLDISKEEQKGIFATVAGILHLGNVEFVAQGESCSIKDRAPLERAARVFQVDPKRLEDRLLTRNIVVQNQNIVSPLNKENAEANRDSIAKGLYDGLFLSVVDRINQVSGAEETNNHWIGTLDVFGFEIFENNSFEQFCINFANERLQSFFNFHVLKAEQELYRREALLWIPIDLPENQDVIDLIMGKPHGIFGILDSACVQPKGDDIVFTQNLFQVQGENPRLEKQTRCPNRKSGQRYTRFNGFSVKHYAGDVVYDAANFLTKNQDTTHPDTAKLFQTSTSEITRKVVTMSAAERTNRPRRGSLGFSSVSSVFSYQLNSLMTTLDQTTPYFVRCIKPNTTKKPKNFVNDYVRPQLRYGGLIEALRIIKCGFPTRCSYERIFEHFGSIVDEMPTVTNLNKRDFTEAIVRVCGDSEVDRSQYQLGLSMIFFRPGKQQFFQKILELSPESLSKEQKKEIHKWLIHKRIVRMCGMIKASLRAKHFLIFRRFQRAATIVNIMNKTMFRAARRAKIRVGSLRAEEEEARRLRDAKYQQALLAAERVKQMEAAEESLKLKLKMEKEALKTAQDDLEAARAEMKTLKSKSKALTDRINELEAEIQTANSGKKALAQELAQNKQEVAQAIDEVERLSVQLKQQEAKFQRELQQLMEDHENARKAAGSDKSSLEHELSIRGQEIFTLQSQLAAASEEASAACAKVEQLSMDLRNTQQRLEAQVSELQDQLRSRKRAFEDREGELERELSSTNQTVAKLQAQLNTVQKHLEDHQASAQKDSVYMKDVESKLKVSLAEKEEELADREKDLRSLKTKSAAREGELQSELENATRTAASLKESLERAKKDAEEREQELEGALDAEKKAARGKSEDDQQQIRERDAKISQAASELNSLKDELASAQHMLSNKENQISALHKRLEDERLQYEMNVQAKRAGFDDEVSAMREKLNAQKSVTADAEQQLQDALARVASLESELRALKDSSSQDAERNASQASQLQQEIASLTKEKKRAQTTIDQLTMDAEEKEICFKQKISSLKEEIKEAEAKRKRVEEEAEEQAQKLKKQLREVQESALQEAESSLEAAQQQYKDLEAESAREIKDRDDMRMREIRQKEAEIQDIKRQLQSANDRVTSVEHDLEQAKEDSIANGRKYKDEKEDMEGEMERLKRKVADISKQLAQANSTIEEQREQLNLAARSQTALNARHQEEVDQLTAALSESEEKTEKALTDKDRITHQLNASLLEEQQKLEEASERFERELKMLKESSAQEIKTAHTSLEKEKRRIAAMPTGATKAELAAWEAKAKDYEAQLKRLQRAESDLMHDLFKAKEEAMANRRLSESKDKVISESARLFEAQTESNRAALKKLQQKYELLRQEGEEAAQAENRALNQIVQRTKSEVRELKELESGYVQKIGSLSRSVATLTKRLKSTELNAETKAQSLETKHLAEMQALKSKNAREVQLLNNTVAQLRDSAVRMEAEFERQMTREVQGAQDRLRQELEHQMAALEFNKKSASDELLTAQDSINQLTREVQDAKLIKMDYETTIAELKESLAAAMADIAKEKRQAEQTVAEMEIEKADLLTQNKVLKMQTDNTADSVASTVQELEAENRMLRQRLAEYSSSTVSPFEIVGEISSPPSPLATTEGVDTETDTTSTELPAETTLKSPIHQPEEEGLASPEGLVVA